MASYCDTAGCTFSTTETNLGNVHQICSMCGAERSHDEIVDRAISDVSYGYDGPVTSYVIIARAMRAVASGKHHPVAMANAVAQLLNVES